MKNSELLKQGKILEAIIDGNKTERYYRFVNGVIQYSDYSLKKWRISRVQGLSHFDNGEFVVID